MSELTLVWALAAAAMLWALWRVGAALNASASLRQERNAALVVDTATGEARRKCPACGNQFVYRSRARGLGERLRRDLASRRLFRCDGCGWRGWLVVIDKAVATQGAAPSVDLGELDQQQAVAQKKRRKRVQLGDLD